MSRSQPRLGRAEFEILRYVVEQHPVTARAVADHVAETAGQARTTVVTVLERLRKKGYLRRKRVDRVYQYSPAVAQQTVVEGMVKDFVSRILSGSVSPLFAYLADNDGITDDELTKLKRLVADLEKDRKRRS